MTHRRMARTSACLAAASWLLAACAASDAPVWERPTNSEPLAFSFEGGRGLEICLGCRLERDVTRSTPLVVHKDMPSDCSRWVSRRFSNHRHTWQVAGCWGSPGGSFLTLATYPLEELSPDEWLAYLQALPSERRAPAIAAASASEAGTSDIERDAFAWLDWTKGRGAWHP